MTEVKVINIGGGGGETKRKEVNFIGVPLPESCKSRLTDTFILKEKY
jgi:hypothetical protein